MNHVNFKGENGFCQRCGQETNYGIKTKQGEILCDNCWKRGQPESEAARSWNNPIQISPLKREVGRAATSVTLAGAPPIPARPLLSVYGSSSSF